MLSHSEDTWFQAIVRRNARSWNWCFLTCTRRMGSLTGSVECVSFLASCVAYGQLQKVPVLPEIWGKQKNVDSGISHKGGWAEDLWMLQDFSILPSSPLTCTSWQSVLGSPSPRQSLQSIPSFHPASSLLPCLASRFLSSLWSSPKECQSILVPLWCYQRFLLQQFYAFHLPLPALSRLHKWEVSLHFLACRCLTLGCLVSNSWLFPNCCPKAETCCCPCVCVTDY